MHITFLSAFSYLEKPKKSLWLLKDFIVKFLMIISSFNSRMNFSISVKRFISDRKKKDVAIFCLLLNMLRENIEQHPR